MLASGLSSLTLDGTGDYVHVANSPDLTPTSAMTLEAWVRRAESRCETILSKDYRTSYWLGFCNDKIRFYSGGIGTSQDGNITIPANVWTHVAVVWTSGAERRYYINGDLEYRGLAGTTTTDNGRNLFIGGSPGASPLDSTFELKGNLAEVRIWNVARGQDDIRRTMHVALTEPLPETLTRTRSSPRRIVPSQQQI